MATHERSTAETLVRSNRISRNCTAVVMNSTVRDHQLGAESRAAMSCELSTINNSEMPLKRVMDTPAKVFARLKAKIQRQTSEEHCGFNVVPRQPCRAAATFTKMQEAPVDDGTSDEHDTYVLTLSPPECISKNTKVSQMTLHPESAEGHTQDMVHKSSLQKMFFDTMPHIKAQQKKTGKNSIIKSTNINQEAYVLLDRLPDDLSSQLGPAKPIQFRNCLKNRGYHGVFGESNIKDDLEGAVEDSNRMDTVQCSDVTDQSQPGSESREKLSNRPCKHLETPPQTVFNLMEDSLLQLSPRISIPKKQKAYKPQIQEKDKALDGRINATEIHLKDWILKLHNKELIVDGIRTDNKIPWHSSCITERVSNYILKTASGGTYVLVGKMSHYHGSSFPLWVIKKFRFGFPEMWKEYLNKFLTETERSGKNQQKNNSAPGEPQKKWPSRKQTSKQLTSKDSVTSVSSAGSIQPHIAPVSRSGRLIKPPLEYWRGGRITVGPDLNVTVHEDYTSTSILLTPNARPVVRLKSLKGQSAYKSSEMQNSNDEETLAPKRRIKQRKSWRTEGTKAWEITSQNKSQDSVFSSDSGTEKPIAKPPSQQEQPEQMYLRRGRSYTREKTSTGSETEASTFGACSGSAEAGVYAVQAPERKNKTRLKNNFLQSDQHLTTCSDSDNSSTHHQVQKSAGSEHLFIPSDSTKGCKRKALKQRSKTVSSKTTTPKTNDPDSYIHQGKVNNRKNTQRKNRTVLQKYDYVATASDNSPPSVLSKGDESKNLKSTLKRTRQKKSPVIEKTANGHAVLVDAHPEQFKKEDNLQPPVPNKTRGKPKQSTSKINAGKTKNTKPREIEQDVLQGAWTDEELEKLNVALNSLPMHKSGYWVDVSSVVGTRSAEECQKQYTALYQTHGRNKRKHKAKTTKTVESAKEAGSITAKVGTLKRKKQMWEFLDHVPKDDHDDVFAGSPMRSKQIKLPLWSTKGDEPDFGHFQNPQTPRSSMLSSVQTPQCLHITPGMLRSVNRDNNDKYVYHLQKVKKHGKKSIPKDKFTPVPSARKMKRCVAEDDNFVVWNMLSDKDGPSVRADEEEEEDDYFMEEY